MSPTQLQAQLGQAVAHHQAGRWNEAEAAYARLCAAAPRAFDVWHLAGAFALQRGHTSLALDRLTRATAINPASTPAALRLGLAELTAGRLADAEARFRATLERHPDSAEAWENLGHALKRQDRLEEALACHRKVTELKPTSAPGWAHYGQTLSLCGQTADAIVAHRRALELDPKYARAQFGLAQALQQSGRPREALTAYDRFCALEPRHLEARSQRLLVLQYLDDRNREQIRDEHVAFGRSLGAPVAATVTQPDPTRRLRLAILSPDLRQHSCAYFLEPLLRHLDPTEFDLLLYHDHIREDAVSKRLQARATVWRNLVGRPNAEAADVIRADRPDIVIDLAGHTAPVCRLPLFVRGLAPVQLTYLGYPDTTGVPGIHARLTDAVADPEGDADGFATERLLRFAPTAWCYEPPAQAPDVAPPPAAADFGAPITFGCFNHPAKISPTTVAVWAGVLAAVPHSRLVLKGRGLEDEINVAGLRQQFAEHGVTPDRIELLGRTPGTAGHLACYHRVDVALDTFPYHGTTTTCEALWMGRPVVTLCGDSHRSRVGASLLRAIGRPRWIAGSPAEYVRIAAQLAAERSALAAESAGLRATLSASPLLDHAGQARRFAAALRACWVDRCARAQAA